MPVTVPAGTKFMGVDPLVSTAEKRSTLSNSYQEFYTIEDIVLTASGSDTNIYNTSGTLTANRTVTMSGNTLNFSGGNIGINQPTPTVPLHIKGTAIPSVNESLARFEVSDATGAYLSLDNASLVNGEFVPQVIGRQNSGSTQSALYVSAAIDATQDTGTNPVTVFRSALASLASVVTRPIFQFKNWATDVMTILANGNVGIGTTTPTEKLEVSGKTKTTTFQMTTTPTAGYVLTSDASGNGSWTALPVEIQVAASDETTALTTGTAKVTFRMPYAMTLTSVRASLSTAQASGSIFTVDVNQGGSSIISTKITIDNTEKTSTTAATPPVISTSALTDDSEITIDIDQIGDGTAKGLKVTLIGTRV